MKNKKTILTLQKMKGKEKITWITAYDLPFAQAAERAGVDMILVGDSGGMVQLGYETTNPVTMDEMIIMSKSARRGAPNTFLVGDMPQGSYEISDELAVQNALRFVKEAGVDAIKLVGGARVASRVRAIVNAGISVIGHLGLTPQSTSSFGGYKVQGKSRESFDSTYIDAQALVESGISLLLLEAMPEASAAKIAEKTKVPVLGIGTGIDVDGQLVIMHDLMGFYQSFRPWFAKCYIPYVLEQFSEYLNTIILDELDPMDSVLKDLGRSNQSDGLLKLAEMAISKYIKEVKELQFPDFNYTYPMTSGQLLDVSGSKYW
jgi:3-methyl-2-oxobutanoate hydroxymethyltransferase